LKLPKVFISIPIGMEAASFVRLGTNGLKQVATLEFNSSTLIPGRIGECKYTLTQIAAKTSYRLLILGRRDSGA